MSIRRFWSAISLLLLVAANSVQADARAPIRSGDRYVSLGSSYAAGPGIPDPADGPRDRCARSTNNYARQLARAAGLVLTDVSCGGAVTRDLLEGRQGQAAQLDAVTVDTRLVTVTIGGNDVNFVGSLGAAYCRGVRSGAGGDTQGCPRLAAPTEAAWQSLTANLERVGHEVHRRAPGATLVFVDYLRVLPARGECGALPLLKEDAALAPQVAQRLAEVTARAAKRTGARVLRASRLSRGHDACSTTPWAFGGPSATKGRTAFAPFHPNAAGMAAIAAHLRRMLRL